MSQGVDSSVGDDGESGGCLGGSPSGSGCNCEETGVGLCELVDWVISFVRVRSAVSSLC